MNDPNETGLWGEEIAAKYLTENGFTLRCRNFRFQHCEIDLIAEKDGTLIFIEVKTRKWTAYGLPETFVNAGKARLIKRAAEHYIFRYDWQSDIRFDIIGIITAAVDAYSIHHIEDAFC
ncbi:YraN family protein [Ravibacter arvi]|uniref:UPF0102 protein GCM10023091_20120 n=1 Tax=Ravibacter arvi TaxID=2051041 RepID=A0ABP8LXF1_9BACT